MYFFSEIVYQCIIGGNMSLSSNSLFHFTKSLSSLEGILNDSFKISYCVEEINYVKIKRKLVMPMVSFCDIPLSQMKNHINSYGDYGIGLTKEWAQRKGLNPVLYMEKGSNLCYCMEEIYKKFLKGNNSFETSNWEDHQRQILDIQRYVKRYQGDLIRRDGTKMPNYRFSDEREWRYVPPIRDDFLNVVPETAYLAERNKNVIRDYKRNISCERLEFNPNDIKYIVVKGEAEILPIVNHLQNVKGKNYSFEEIQRLSTRIITSNQIATDF